ncbi:family 16 glycosylhydrolase [Altererythrobacter sp. GH1-8]|uniref:family 16 glycosylhydrolase n=1 Tax=Altererythrobacter sp. GH1-8 TaxID=3349333 RepID=UPI00374D94C3
MITIFSASGKELIVASRISTILALCVLTSASIHPLTAAPRQIKIAPDGSVTSDTSQEPIGKGNLKRTDPGPKKKLPGEDVVSDGGSGTGGSGDGGAPDTGGAGSDLPPIDLSDMALWNWYGKWHASNWDNPWSSFPYRYDHVSQDEAGNTYFTFDAQGAPELKAQNGHPYSKKAFYEVDVTLPELRSGLVVAPLWLWHDQTRDEVDFEFVGDQFLQVTVHSYRSGSHRTQEHRMTGNFSGQRMKLGIETDLAGGQIRMLVNGQLVHTFYNNTNAFPTGEMRPVISMWVGDKTSWAEPWTGRWEGLTNGEQVVMTVHGYRFEQR